MSEVREARGSKRINAASDRRWSEADFREPCPRDTRESAPNLLERKGEKRIDAAVPEGII
jgi:hypothetical protein